MNSRKRCNLGVLEPVITQAWVICHGRGCGLVKKKNLPSSLRGLQLGILLILLFLSGFLGWKKSQQKMRQNFEEKPCKVATVVAEDKEKGVPNNGE